MLDPLLQHAFLARGLGFSLVHRLGAQAIPLVTSDNLLDLSPYQTAILATAVGTSLKQVFWILFISQEEMRVGMAVTIAGFNTVFNSLNSLLFICDLTSAAQDRDIMELTLRRPVLAVGACFYAVGIFQETVAEVQRRNFKMDPNNKGKPYSGGLFSLARNINYGGYTPWRAGYAMASAGWAWAAVVGGFFFYDFATRGVPVLDQYCQKRVSLCPLIA